MAEIVTANPYLERVSTIQELQQNLQTSIRSKETQIGSLQRELKSNQEKIKKGDQLIESSYVQALQYVLREAGLGVCDFGGKHNLLGGEGELIPLNMLLLLYQKKYWAGGYHASYNIYVATFCPEHFPSLPNQITSSKQYAPMLEESSEVKKEGDRFIKVLDGQDASLYKLGDDDKEVPLRQGYTKEMFNKFGIPKPDHLRHTGFANYWHGSLRDICQPIPQLTFETAGPPWLKYG